MKLTDLNTRQELIDCMTHHLLEHGEDVVQVEHNFIDGHYLRTMHVKKGTCLVGYKHLKAHLNMLIKGSCRIFSNFRTLDLSGFQVFASPQGEQKTFYFYEDSEYTTVHVTKETDIKTIEKEFVLRAIPPKEFLEVNK